MTDLRVSVHSAKPRLRQKHLLVLVVFYVFFAGLYVLTITLSQSYSLSKIYTTSVRVAIDYFLKALFTLPVWYIVIYRMDQASIQHKLLVHLLLCPLYIIVWFYSYYFVIDLAGIQGLRGGGRWWDVYIPVLVYTAQFALIHNYWYNHKLRFQTQHAYHLREMILKSEVSALKAQINPHFLFNTLNSISASVPPELENTRNMVAKLADIFRYVLLASQKEKVLLKEELSFIKNYLDLEKERFGERLQTQYIIDDTALNIAIPPMLLQPLAENSVKHGISPSIEGGTIILTAKVSENQLHISIEDDGVATKDAFPDDAFEKGIGLKNTFLRIEKLYQTQLEVRFKSPHGLIVQCSIPITNSPIYETNTHY